MNLIKGLKNNASQIFAVTEKNVRLASRHKLPLILTFITPMLGIILPIIVLGKILTFTDNFGPWDDGNFLVYQFTAYQLLILYQIIARFTTGISQEKSTNTFTLLIIAPFRRTNLLFGIFFSHLILIAIPFMSFFILCYILFPVSLITLFFIFSIYFLIALFFSGIGLVLSIFIISKPRLAPLFSIPLTILIMFSCISMPFEFFPETFQNITNLNPFYYVFVIVRYVWIDDNIIISITSHPTTFLIVFSSALISPLIGLKFFNYIFDKYRIQIY